MHLSSLLLHVPACAPDAGISDYVGPRSDAASERMSIAESLLHCADAEECWKCQRKRRRVSFHAYPSQQDLHLPWRASRPKPRGCRLLLLRLKHLACCMQSRRKYHLAKRYQYHKQKKPYSAITVQVEQLTTETYDEDDLAGIPDLIEVVKLQASGPAEVARALRKKLKYGNVHRQVRALTILDGLLQNGGPRLQRTLLSDEPLLERLRIAAVDPVSDPDVRSKCKDLFGQWAASAKDNPGLDGAKSLYNQLPKKAKPSTQQQRREQSRVLRETEEDVQREQEEDEPPPRRSSVASTSTPRKNSTSILPVSLGSSSTFGTKKVKKDKKTKGSKFDLDKERPNILNTIAASSVAATNLGNALKLVNRESARVSDDAEVVKRFETCKHLRRQVLRYIQYIETDEFLGGLIHANEELIESLMAFEILDKSVDDDSDSELEEAQHLSRRHAASEKSAEKAVANLSINPQRRAPPPRPAKKIAMPPPQRWQQKQAEIEDDSDEEDEDPEDPFGDSNAAKTPLNEKKGFTFREV